MWCLSLNSEVAKRSQLAIPAILRKGDHNEPLAKLLQDCGKQKGKKKNIKERFEFEF